MKLYVRVLCYVCRNKTTNCYACSGLGYEYVEASDKYICDYLSTADEEIKKIFLDTLQK